MKLTIFQILFGCWHHNYTFPQTVRDRKRLRQIPAARFTGAYVVCLDCAKEFPFDPERWAVITGQETKLSRVRKYLLTAI
jgi:hypothetical protein